jgi:hypothetical protein
MFHLLSSHKVVKGVVPSIFLVLIEHSAPCIYIDLSLPKGLKTNQNLSCSFYFVTQIVNLIFSNPHICL